MSANRDHGRGRFPRRGASIPRSVEEVFAHLRGKVYFVGDPNEPTAGEWEEL
jgi:hypothetical protein